MVALTHWMAGTGAAFKACAGMLPSCASEAETYLTVHSSFSRGAPTSFQVRGLLALRAASTAGWKRCSRTRVLARRP